MLDDDKTTPENGENTSNEAGADAPATPVVRKTRKAPARRTTKKAASAPAVEAVGGAEDGAAETPAAAPAAEPEAAAPAPAKRAPRKTAAKRPAKKVAAAPAEAPAEAQAALPVDAAPETGNAAGEEAPAAKAPARKTTRKAPARKTAKKAAPAEPAADAAAPAEVAGSSAEPTTEAAAEAPAGPAVLFQAPVATPRRTRKKAAAAEPATEQTAEQAAEPSAEAGATVGADAQAETPERPAKGAGKGRAAGTGAAKGASKGKGRAKAAAAADEAQEEDEVLAAASDTEVEGSDEDETVAEQAEVEADQAEGSDEEPAEGENDEGETSASRRRRRRGGRRRRKSGDGGAAEGDSAEQSAEAETQESGEAETTSDEAETTGEGSSRRRRRRRRAGEEGGAEGDDEPNTVTRVRKGRSAEDQITAVSGSTRLEAKKQRRREGREAGRRRAPIVSEAEFLARRESVDRVMVIRQREDLTQIAVLEDKVLVEHYVARESQTSLIGNVYLGRVQNVLPSMEAAFIDIGKGRNAVLYAGEVNWSALGHKEGQPRKIESVLQSGQPVLVQVTKDPVGHKGARLTSQISLAGRFLVYVPDGTTSGISRKLPDTERNRLKTLLKEIVPDSAGVIVRTAAEGASEDELTSDVERLKARWEDIEKKAKGSAPQLLYGEPDLTLKVVRDLFTEDFSKLVIEGPDAWDTVQGYVAHVAPDLEDRLERFEPASEGRDAGKDAFAAYRIEEQIQKGLDRKVWLPSGGSLIIDRTEAMTVVDVNTGKFTGSGGNLEETVTKNNLEAAEEIVRQLRLRDIGGIIVVDFIDMVLESNRDLVVRRLVECLGRDRTRHQVAEVTSLGLVQMTRKRIGTGLLEAFSENCEHCHGRGVVIKDAPVEPGKGGGGSEDEGRRSSRRNRGRKGGGDGNNGNSGNAAQSAAPSPKDVAAMARHEKLSESESEPQSGAQSEGAEPAVVETAAEVPTEAPAAASSETAAEKPAEAPAEATPDAPAEPGRPQVVTRTRRRGGASRPAEAPVSTQPEPVVQREAETPAETATETVTAPVAETPAESVPGSTPEVAPEVAPEVTKPQVVTRTRRRSASRPAGPPAAQVGVTGTLPTSGQVEPGTAVLEPGSGDGARDGGHPDAPTVEHVPVKKKGTRKR